MSNGIYFEKYILMLRNASKSKKDYENLRNLCIKEAIIVDEEKRLLVDAENAHKQLSQMKQCCINCYNEIIGLLDCKPTKNNIKALPDTVSMEEFKHELRDFNALAERIVVSGGTESETVERFIDSYKVLRRYFDLLERGRYAYKTLCDVVKAGKETALDALASDIASARKEMRRLLGISDEDIMEHGLFFAPEESIYKSGLRFPQQNDKYIKLGEASVELEKDEKIIVSDVYPEFKLGNNKLTVPFTFSTGDSYKNSNIYIEYDDKNPIDQLKIAVHQIILKFISEFPAGKLFIRYADCTDYSLAYLDNISVRFDEAVSNMTDKGASAMLREKLCPQSIYGASKIAEFLNIEFAQREANNTYKLRGQAIEHGLYVLFGFSSKLSTEALANFRTNFGYKGMASSFGIHNLIVVAKSDIEEAQRLAKDTNDRNAEREKAKNFLDVLDTIKKASVCFEHSGGKSFTLISSEYDKKISVRFGDETFENYDDFDKECIEVINGIVPRFALDTASPFIDLDSADAINDDYVIGCYRDNKKDIPLTGKENIAVIFADDTFGSVEKSRIMSSLTLGYFAKFEPGFMKLYPVIKESTSNIMHVVNGFTNTSKKNNQSYSLTDNCLDSDTIVSRMDSIKSIIDETSRLLLERNSENDNDSKYSIYDMVEEDNTKNLRLIYGSYSDNDARYDDSYKYVISAAAHSKNNNDCGVHCILEITSTQADEWSNRLSSSGIFDHIIVAKSHDFYDLTKKNSRLRLSVLKDYSYAFNAARSMVNSYIEIETTAIKYEEVGFGSEAVRNEDINAMISIPVGITNGKPTTLDFDCLGSLIGYMVQGSTGSGKSSLLYSLIINGAMKYSPRALQFYLLDFKSEKGETFKVFRSAKNPIPHIKQLSVKNDAEAAETIFEGIKEEQEARNRLFEKYDVSDIKAYNDAEIRAAADAGVEPQILPRLIVIIDECHMAFEDEKHTSLNRELAGRFANLTTQGRAYGIHFVVTTQVMSATLAGIIGKQLSGRCSFKMINMEDNVLFPKDAASSIRNLPLKSAMLLSRDGGNHCEQVRVAFHNNAIDVYTKKIRERWAKYINDYVTFELGNEEALKVPAKKLPAVVYVEGRMPFVRIPFSMDCVKGTDVSITFAEKDNNALLMVGSNSSLASKIMASMLYGVRSLGDRIGKVMLHVNDYNNDTVDTVIEMLGKEQVTNDTEKVLSDVYFELKHRMEVRRNAEHGHPITFKPWFVVFDDLNENTVTEQHNDNSNNTHHSVRKTEEVAQFNLSVFNKAPKYTEREELPERKIVWETIAREGSKYGIYISVYIKDPKNFKSRITYFNSFNHMITFPGGMISEYARNNSGNVELPMSGSGERTEERSRAFKSTFAENAAVCYYLTTASSTSNSGLGVYKVKPYIINND